MRRKLKKKKFNNLVDLKYQNSNINKLINILMKEGKKFKAVNIVYNVLTMLKQKFKQNPVKIFNKAIKNIIMEVEIKKKKLGGVIIEYPNKINKIKGIKIALKWIKEFINCFNKGNKILILFNLLIELYNYNNINYLIKKKIRLYKTAEINRMFSNQIK